MKQLSLVFLICISLCVSSFAQVPAYDATKLATKDINGKLIVAGNESNYRILAGYVKSATGNSPGKAEILEAFRDNPFFEVAGSSRSFLNLGVGNLTGIVSSKKGIDVTNLTDALAKFMIKRAKEELIISFFNMLKNNLKIPEIKSLLPSAMNLINTIQPWEYANHINTLRAALDDDLSNLLGNLGGLKNITTLLPLTNDNGTKQKLLDLDKIFSDKKGLLSFSSLKIGNGILKGEGISEVLDSVAGKKYLGNAHGVSKDDQQKLKLMSIMSGSVKDIPGGGQFLSRNQFNGIYENDMMRSLYLGLLFQQLQNAGINIAGINAGSLVNAENTGNVKAYIDNLLGPAESLVLANNSLLGATTGKLVNLGGVKNVLFESAGNVLQATGNLELLHGNLDLSADLNTLIHSGTQTIAAAGKISVSDYSAAVMNLVNMLTQNLGNTGVVGELLNNILKYTSFATNLVGAQNSDELEKAIENIALPVGSATIKKHSSFNLSLNAYLGAFWGKQRQATDKIFVPAIGVYAPVGLAASWGIDRGYKEKGGTRIKREPMSFTAFISIIDISPMVSFRLKNYNSEIADDVNIRLSQIVSPGIHGAIGLPGLPISVGSGINWTPLLTRVERQQTTLNPDGKRPFRWQIFAAVDIPIINIINKPSKK